MDLRVPILLRMGNQASIQVARGHIEITLQSLLGNRESSRTEAEHSVVLSSCDRLLSVLMESKQGNWALSHFEAWTSAFFSRCKRGVMSPVGFRR